MPAGATLAADAPNRVARVLKVRPGEGRTAALGVGAIMSAAVGATFGQSGADALFFARSGVDRLPVLLLISGALMAAASFVLTWLLGRVVPARLFVLLPATAAGVVLVERVIVATDVSWIYPVLWLTVGVSQMVQGLYTWGTYGVVVDTRQAKRLFPLFGAGWIVGWVVGGVLTRPLAALIGAENLLLVWAAGLAAAFVCGRALLGAAGRVRPTTGRRSHRPPPAVLDEMRQGFRAVRASPLLRWMSLAAMLFSVLFFSLYLPFSRAATERFPDADALAGFFGLFSAVTAGAALLWSVLLTGRLFSRFGVTTMLLLLPVLYAAGFGILIVNAAFVTIVAVRFAQMLWLQAVANPAWEAIVNVLPPTRRDQTRAFLNGVPSQAGTVIAGVIQLVGEKALSPTALYSIGAGTAVVTTVACWRVRRSYGGALLDAVRAGRPLIFPSGASSLLGSGVDASAVTAAVAAAGDGDAGVRRLAVEMLGDLPVPEARRALRAALHDEDATVRAAALRSLTDPGRDELMAALADADLEVRCAAAAGLLRAGAGEQALAVLRPVLDGDDPDARYVALEALAAAASPGAFELGVRGLADPVPRIRGAAAHVLAGADPVRALPPLVDALDDADPDVRSALCAALADIGPPAVAAVVPALFDPTRSEGALRALEGLPADGKRPELVRFADEEAARAVADFEVSRRIAADGEAARLLIDSLVDRARRRGRHALRATALLDGQASGLAIDSLSDGDPVLVANALEALESLPRVVRPLLRLWEPAVPDDAPREAWLPALLTDDDPWIRDCAELVRSTTEGRPMNDVHTTLTDMERVLFLRRVSLFGELPPRDLARISAVATERTFIDGETIAGQGESGDEMHIVVSGRVRVLRAAPGGDEAELAVRTEGDVVGEMALITREPRMASLVADGEARTLQLGRREFEGVLRERPDTAIALIRILSHRLAESGATS